MNTDPAGQAVPDDGADSPPSPADIINKHTPSGAEGNVRCWCDQRFDSFREHAEHVAEAWREALTIRTPEQLAAVPGAAVVRDADGYIVERRYVTLPALILWHPDWDPVQ